MKIIKRNGNLEAFEIEKIINAIKKANESVSPNDRLEDFEVQAIANNVQHKCAARTEPVHVEEIQDMVERQLMNFDRYQLAKNYILYRKQREKVRNINEATINYKTLVDDYLNVNDWRVKENSTVNYSIGGLILSNSGAITANYWLNEVYDEEIANAHKKADIHIHDLSMLSAYCAGWNLKQLIEEGLGGVPGKITSKPASHLSTLCNQMVNFLGITQNEFAG